MAADEIESFFTRGKMLACIARGCYHIYDSLLKGISVHEKMDMRADVRPAAGGGMRIGAGIEHG